VVSLLGFGLVVSDRDHVDSRSPKTAIPYAAGARDRSPRIVPPPLTLMGWRAPSHNAVARSVATAGPPSCWFAQLESAPPLLNGSVFWTGAAEGGAAPEERSRPHDCRRPDEGPCPIAENNLPGTSTQGQGSAGT